jgi:hypothetical protein
MYNKIVLLLSLSCLLSSVFAQTTVEARKDQNSPWTSYLAEQFSDFKDFTPTVVTLNQYGSNMSYKTTATGFFRTEKVNNRWYIIDPEGYIFIHKGVAGVAPGTSENQMKALESKWGTNDVWCTDTNNWLKNNGFNGIGAWSDVSHFKNQVEPLVYTVIINPMSSYRDYPKKLVGGYTNAGWQGYEYNIIRVFDPLFETYMDNACKTLAQYKNDKYLLGYFVDNELPWVNDALDRFIKYLDVNDPCYIAVKNWLDQRKGKNAGLSDITADDRCAFWDFYAGKYFRMAKSYITKYDPNHMFLGSRFNQENEELSNPYIFKTAGESCDIISINHYQKWEPIEAEMSDWELWSQKPFIITEFYTKGEDSGMANTTGAGWLVKTQNDRGLFYENFIIKLLRSKGCVGWNWVLYQDNDPQDSTTDESNKDSNKGIVNITYDPYVDLINLCKLTNNNVYRFLDYLKTSTSEANFELFPTKDNYIRLQSTDNEIHGSETLLRVKNSSGSTYERTGLLQFDFTPYLKELSNLDQIVLKVTLEGIYPGTNDPNYDILNIYKVENFDFEESTPNAELLSAYLKRTEYAVGNVSIPINKLSQNLTFSIDISNLISLLPQNPIITLRLQMETPTETQFEFASKENGNSLAKPVLEMLVKKENTALKNTFLNNQIKLSNQGNKLIINGLKNDSTIQICTINGETVFNLKKYKGTMLTLKKDPNWGKIVLVKISDENGSKTIKLSI